MSEQISEKMARKLARQVADYTCDKQADQFDLAARCMRAWRAAGLIKPSKLDEARAYVQKMRDFPRSYPPNAADMGIKVADMFELAITEILEERE